MKSYYYHSEHFTTIDQDRTG